MKRFIITTILLATLVFIGGRRASANMTLELRVNGSRLRLNGGLKESIGFNKINNSVLSAKFNDKDIDFGKY